MESRCFKPEIYPKRIQFQGHPDFEPYRPVQHVCAPPRMVPAIDSRYSRFLPLQKKKDFALSLGCFELNSGSTRVDQRTQKISHGILNQSSFDPSISAIQIGGDKMVSERFRAIKKKTMEKDGPEPAGRFSLGKKRDPNCPKPDPFV